MSLVIVTLSLQFVIHAIHTVFILGRILSVN